VELKAEVIQYSKLFDEGEKQLRNNDGFDQFFYSSSVVSVFTDRSRPMFIDDTDHGNINE